jgi:hypothetical protein
LLTDDLHEAPLVDRGVERYPPDRPTVPAPDFPSYVAR